MQNLILRKPFLQKPFLQKSFLRFNSIIPLYKHYNNIIDTVIFDLCDTIIYPKKNHLSARTQTFVSTFTQLDYDAYSLDFIKILNKYYNLSNYDMLHSILNDPDINKLYYNNNNFNFSISKIYDLFLTNYSVVLQNPNYSSIEPSIINTIKILQNQGVKNFIATTDLNWKLTSIILNSMKHQGLELHQVISQETENSSTINKIIKSANTKPENCIKVSCKFDSIIEAKNESVYSVILLNNKQIHKPLEFIVEGADYIVHRIGQLPYIVSKIKCDL